MGANQDDPKSGFAENTITLGLTIFTQNIRITYGNNIPWGQIKITQNLDSQKIKWHWAAIFLPNKSGLHVEMGFQLDKLTLSNIWVRKTRVTRGLNICTHDMRITYENDISRGHIKITQHLDSQKIRLHWASIFLPRTYWLHMKMISHGDKTRLPNIWIRRKYDFTGPPYLYTKHNGYTWK